MQDFTYEYPGVQDSVLGIILGGGAGSRLFPLTKKRAKPAVPLGGNYRLIDIPVSNCLHSNINKIYCLTQFNSASLNRHLSNAYNVNVGSMTSKGFVEVLAATQTPGKEMWFQGAPPPPPSTPPVPLPRPATPLPARARRRHGGRGAAVHVAV